VAVKTNAMIGTSTTSFSLNTPANDRGRSETDLRYEGQRTMKGKQGEKSEEAQDEMDADDVRL